MLNILWLFMCRYFIEIDIEYILDFNHFMEWIIYKTLEALKNYTTSMHSYIKPMQCSKVVETFFHAKFRQNIK